MFLKLLSRLVFREAPPDRSPDSIPLLRPGPDFLRQGWDVANAPIQALLGQSRQLDFHHLQPTAFFRRVMGVKLLDERQNGC
jgi:hypothetical protein